MNNILVKGKKRLPDIQEQVLVGRLPFCRQYATDPAGLHMRIVIISLSWDAKMSSKSAKRFCFWGGSTCGESTCLIPSCPPLYLLIPSDNFPSSLKKKQDLKQDRKQFFQNNSNKKLNELSTFRNQETAHKNLHFLHLLWNSYLGQHWACISAFQNTLELGAWSHVQRDAHVLINAGQLYSWTWPSLSS